MYQKIITVNVHTSKAIVSKYDPDDCDIDHEGYIEYVDGKNGKRSKEDIIVMAKNIIAGIVFAVASIVVVPLEPQEAGILPLIAVPAGIATIVSAIRGGNPLNY